MSHTHAFSNQFKCHKVSWFAPSELWHLGVVTLSEKLLREQIKGSGSVWCHKYLSNIPISIPHLGPTLTTFMTSLYDVSSIIYLSLHVFSQEHKESSRGVDG